MASLVIAAAPFETQDSNQQLKKKKKSTKSDQYMALASQQQHMQHMQPQPQTQIQIQTMQPQPSQHQPGNYPQPTPGLPATPVNQQEQILKVLHNQNVQQQQHYEYEQQQHPRSLIQVPTPLTDHGYAQYITQPAATQPVRKQRNREDLLMERVQYMIHLLEAQKMERTDHVMEEFLLYTLLGVFIIYLCDSFSRVGKYQR